MCIRDSVYAGLILCNIVLLGITLLIYRAFTKICSMETTIIFPCVLAFCVIGVYALNSNLDDVLSLIHISPVCWVCAWP